VKVDVSKSAYHEAPEAKAEFNRSELRSLRLLLRRLRFLEAQVRQSGGLRDGSASGGAAFAEWEIEALEWVMTEVGFLSEAPEGITYADTVSGNSG
jgi:hypothetical protein